MEINNDFQFLSKPNIDASKLNYIGNTKKVYANLFEIILTRPLKIYQYPYSTSPPLEAGDIKIRQRLFRTCRNSLRETYGECFISGDSLYGIKKVENGLSIPYAQGNTEYILNIQKFAKEVVINQKDIHVDPLGKQCIEMLVRDILHANPKLEFYRDIFVLTDKENKKSIETNNVSVTFYPGFTTSFMETDGGNYLNVTLKNKIIQNETVLDYLNNWDYNDKNEQKAIKDELIGRSFKVSYMKRNHRIDDILFDKNPKNQTFNYDGKTVNLIDYYKEHHKKEIKDKNQPLILVRKKGPQDQVINLYFVPELCSLSGLEDKDVKDGYFMKELAKSTKLDPNDRVININRFLNLFKDPERKKIKKDKKGKKDDKDKKDDKGKKNNKGKADKKDKKDDDDEYEELPSSKEKSDLYGIEIKPLNKLFTAYYMKESKLIAGNNKKITPKDKVFPVLDKKDMTSWICFYEKYNYKNADTLYKTLISASIGYGFKIEEPEWIEMPNKSKDKDWLDTIEDYLGKGKKDYSFAVFLIGDNDNLYYKLKTHSLCTNGYISQVVKDKSFKKKGIMSICSKILLQINAKLGGTSYKVDFNKEINDRDLMIIGVDSSHVKGKGTGVAMVATINKTFTDFFNKEEIIPEKNKSQLQYSISTFIKQAIVAYNKRNKKNPKNIIIYRQGVSYHQKEFLKVEISEIEQECKNNNISFYYILVNTKTTFKFFEKAGNNYINPDSGLLVIDEITNKNFFEFYIQPQQVTEGSATPSCFHVAYGNLDFPEIIPKFTFDLCHIYSNWQGTVRIPNVIKAAEKLSKMTAKYTHKELNDDLKYGQAYL